MPADRVYRLYLRRSFKMPIFGMLGLFTIVGLLLVAGVFQSHDGNGPPRIFGIFWLGMVGWYWYWVLSIPHTITSFENGQIEFTSVLRKRRVAAREIRSIKPDGGQLGFLAIRTDARKIRILNQFDEFHDFITRLKAVNPGVELRGC